MDILLDIMKNSNLTQSIFTIAIYFCFFLQNSFAQDTSFWQNVQERATPIGAKRYIIPSTYQTFALDVQAFLQYIPRVATQNILSLPMPDGSVQRFQIWETPMLSPALALKLPNVRTFTAQGIDDATATAYLDWTEQGFHGMIISANGTVFIDPHHTNDNALYISYNKKDYVNPEKANQRSCQTFEDAYWLKYEKERDLRLANRPFGIRTPNTAERPSGSQKRTYRMAVAATIEYSNFHGGKTQAQNAIITTMNRVRGVYEKELAISFTLVDNTSIVFVGSDNFSNSNANNLINESQTVIDNNIGTSNYDIGHTVSTGGGGLAGLGVICRDGQKARGITGSGSPIGDSYDIDYVAHEVGHQFGGSHTFNGNVGSCAGGNRSSSSAYETGSGSTIMAYAGICGAVNIQSNSDAYFHTRSYDQMVDYSTLSQGNNCPTSINTGNAIPILTMPTGGFFIPIETAFALTASATDGNAGDILTYCWEQYDLGDAGVPENSGGTGPSFRSFSPTLSPIRYFPRASGNPNLSEAIGETLPSTARTFNFRCTVRDNRAVGGVEYGTVTFKVADNAGPFVVTYPNNFLTWQGGSPQNITWNVNGTNAAPVSCANVNIYLSTDGGLTYPTVLATNVPNDGSESIVVPNISSTQTRVKVQGAGNIFFDASDSNFTIALTTSPTFYMQVIAPTTQTIFASTNAVYQIRLSALLGYSADVTLAVSNNPAGTTAVFATNPLSPSALTTLTIGNTNNLIGAYNMTITATSGSITRTVVVRVIINTLPLPPPPANNVLIYPNPASEIITIKIDGAVAEADITITDMLGKVVKSFKITKGTGAFVYDLKIGDRRTSENLPNGQYIMHITAGAETWIRKFVKNEY